MMPVLMRAWDQGVEVHGAFWAEGPKTGTKWMVANGRYLLVRKARRGEPHMGQWMVIQE